MKFILVADLFYLLLLTPAIASAASPWVKPNPEDVIVMQLASGRVVMQLAPEFAPKHVNNVKQLITQDYFNGLKIIRSQDNYVVQWGDPETDEAKQKSLGKAKAKIKVEFFRNVNDIDFVKIDSRDAYANEVGFVNGFPVASDGKQAWLAHCYGMVGVSRDVADDSGNGSGLYVVTGHAPRHLDRNVTLIGRVLEGMDLLSSLPRGKGDLGFYQTAAEYVEIESIKLGNEGQNINLSVMDTNSLDFVEHVAKRTNRKETWFLQPTGKIELCNVGVPQQDKTDLNSSAK